MKNLIVSLFLFLLSAATFAQTISVRTGFDLADMLYKHDYYPDDNRSIPGFLIGGTVEIPILERLSIESGLQIVAKGYKSEGGGSFAQIKDKTHLYYLEIPILAKTTLEFGNMQLYGSVGPYVAIGLSGKTELEVTMGGSTSKQAYEIKWGIESGNDYKRGDFSLMAEAGIRLKPLRIGVSYGIGLKNISVTTSNSQVQKNRVLGVLIGYEFAL